MQNRNKEFVKLYNDAIIAATIDNAGNPNRESDLHLESALCHLITRFADEIPPIQEERFHKSFRQIDVVDQDAHEGLGGCLDMVFWNLLNCNCKIFWELQEEWTSNMKEKEEVPSASD